MAMSSADITAFVRGHLDVDSSDLTDSVIDVFKREGFNRIIRSQSRWPFMEASWTLSTSPGDQTYPFTTASLLTPSAIEDIFSINDELREIRRVPHEDAKQMFPSGATTTGRPMYWSKHADTIYLWPTPDAVYTYAIDGLKKAFDWVAANSAPTDLPDDFHELIALWVLHRGYLQQDDPETAAFYVRQFEDGLHTITGRYLHAPLDRPVVMNRPQRTRTFERALYPNEYAVGYE